MNWNSTFQPLGESVPKDEERSQRVSLATWQWPSECIPSHYTESQTYRQRSRVIKTLDLLLRWLWAVILLFSLSMLICKTDVASSLSCCEDSTKQIWNTWHKGGIKYVFNKRWLLLLLPPYPQIMFWQEAHRALLSLCSKDLAERWGGGGNKSKFRIGVSLPSLNFPGTKPVFSPCLLLPLKKKKKNCNPVVFWTSALEILILNSREGPHSSVFSIPHGGIWCTARISDHCRLESHEYLCQYRR